MSTKLTVDNFISRSNNIHNNKYDYSSVRYISSKVNVEIICPIHGSFEQIPNSHLNGKGCNKCSNFQNAVTKKYNIKDFIDKANKVHNSKYDYSLVNYTLSKNKVIIICPVHGEFEQVAASHLRGRECYICANSRIESKCLIDIDNSLSTYVVHKEYRFNDCRDILPLPFDRYIPELNIIIEYDGSQHFNKTQFNNTIEAFNKIQTHDRVKNEYCESKGINLIRLKYDEKHVNVLDDYIRFVKSNQSGAVIQLHGKRKIV